MYLADTTFIIDVLHSESNAEELLDQLEEGITITDISRFEVLVGAEFSGRDLQKMREFLNGCETMPLTLDAAQRAAKIKGDLMKKGRQISSSDCLIAGTALTFGCNKIITRNKKHFEGIKGIEIIGY